MNDSKILQTLTFDPFDYEEIHMNLKAVHGLIVAMACWQTEEGDDQRAAALYKVAELLGKEVERAEAFFDIALGYYKRMNDGAK